MLTRNIDALMRSVFADQSAPEGSARVRNDHLLSLSAPLQLRSAHVWGVARGFELIGRLKKKNRYQWSQASGSLMFFNCWGYIWLWGLDLYSCLFGGKIWNQTGR
ncbi:unnamed protein product [Caretta caretta]